MIERPSARRCRPLAVRARPNGLPMATTLSPTATSCELPSGAASSASAETLDLEQRDVGLRDRCRRPSPKRGVAVGEADLDFGVVRDHVLVGEDVALLVDDEAGAAARAGLDRDDARGALLVDLRDRLAGVLVGAGRARDGRLRGRGRRSGHGRGGARAGIVEGEVGGGRAAGHAGQGGEDRDGADAEAATAAPGPAAAGRARLRLLGRPKRRQRGRLGLGGVDRCARGTERRAPRPERTERIGSHVGCVPAGAERRLGAGFRLG